MWDQRDVHNFYRSCLPAVIDRNRMYWCGFKKDKDDSDYVTFTVWMFDFEHPERSKTAIKTRREKI